MDETYLVEHLTAFAWLFILVGGVIVIWLIVGTLWMRFHVNIWLVSAIGFTLVLILLAHFWWIFPKMQAFQFSLSNPKDAFTVENEARRTLQSMVGIILALAGAYFGSWKFLEERRNAHKEEEYAQRDIANDEVINQRFNEAIGLLGSPVSPSRLGGMFSLESIARDSPRDHWSIMEILSAYVRDESKAEDAYGSEGGLLSPRVDIQTALTIIGRRHVDYDLSGRRLDFSNSSLVGVDVSYGSFADANFAFTSLKRVCAVGARLRQANLAGADFMEASLSQADLEGANLAGANLAGADLTRANLSNANLDGAMMTGTNLVGATLRGANLHHADLRGAELSNTDLSDTHGITREQFDSSKGNSETKLPVNMTVPAHWRIAD